MVLRQAFPHDRHVVQESWIICQVLGRLRFHLAKLCLYLFSLPFQLGQSLPDTSKDESVRIIVPLESEDLSLLAPID